MGGGRGRAISRSRSDACLQIYTSIRRFKDDLPLRRPDHFVCVPLVLDTLHTKVRRSQGRE